MKAAELPDLREEDTDSIGSGISRVDAIDKVTGRARYTTDVVRPGLLHGAIVRSAVAAGRVTAIDTSDALAVEGVVDVLTGQDLGDARWYDDEVPVLAEIVRLVGDEIAVVVAHDEATARRAVPLVSVEYERHEHLTDPERVGDDDVPELMGNDDIDVEEDGRGDVDAGFESASVVVEGTYRSPVAVHNALEPHGCVADWIGDSLTLYVSTQGVNDVRTMMADRLGLDHSAVRVVCEYMGGGFGAKQVPWKPTMLAALASRHTGHPVRIVNDRPGENLVSGKRAGSIQTVRIGADADGRLVAIDAELTDDKGAYDVPGEASMLAAPFLSLYACDNVRTRSRTVRTNTGPSVAFRAPGYVEATFVLESLMDELAGRLDLDPIELRRRNHTGVDPQSGDEWSHPDGILRSYERVEEESGWSQALGTGGRDLPPGVVRGRGFAAHDWVAASAMPPGHATVQFNFDGSVHVGTSVQDIGTGTRTVLSQVVADELGCDVDTIRLSLGDTSTGPPAPTSAGSTTVPTMAPAVRAAAADAVRDLLDKAAVHLDADRDSLSFDGATVSSTESGVDDVALADLLGELSPKVVHGWGAREDLAENVSPRAQGSAVAEVTVDLWTGEVRVTSVTVAPDCGRILNRRLADSQVIGGVTQGIGFALTEEQVVDHDLGIVVNPDLNEYLLPTVSDTCEIRHAAIDIPDLRANAVGSKGIGELPLIPVPAAIANAIHDATGIRFTELPITRRRMLDALAARDAEGGDE